MFLKGVSPLDWRNGSFVNLNRILVLGGHCLLEDKRLSSRTQFLQSCLRFSDLPVFLELKGTCCQRNETSAGAGPLTVANVRVV